MTSETEVTKIGEFLGKPLPPCEGERHSAYAEDGAVCKCGATKLVAVPIANRPHWFKFVSQPHGEQQ